MKKTLLFLLSLVLFSGINAQEEKTLISRKILNVTLGGQLSSFQDKKFSNERYSGPGGRFHLDFNWSKISYWEIGVDAMYNSEHAKTYDVGNAVKMDYDLYFIFMYPVFNTDEHKLLLGVMANFRYHLRKTNDLSNNTAYLIFGPDFHIQGRYIRPVSDKWTLDASLRFQIMGWVYEGISYSYATSQQVLLDGEYHYNNVPVKLNFVPMWKYFSITTDIHFDYGKRWSFGYRWHMEQSYQVKGFTMTMGYSELYAGFKIVNKAKEKTPKKK